MSLLKKEGNDQRGREMVALVRDKVSGRNTHTESIGATAETFKSSNLK